MVSGKNKGRGFERKIYKILRDSNKFHRVQLTLGSGSSDEPSDLLADNYVVEIKFGNHNYISEANLERWWIKLKEDCSSKEIPILIYKENYKPTMALFILDSLMVRTLFDDWLIWLNEKEV